MMIVTVMLQTMIVTVMLPTVFVTVMLCFIAFGALNNYVMWKHHEATLLGRHSVLCIPVMTQIYHKIQGSMTVLNNLNEAVAIYSKGLSDEEEIKMELDVQRDMYNVVGLLTDIYSKCRMSVLVS